VFDVIEWEDVPSTERVWQIVVNFLTKRTKDNTSERECIDKRKCRVCFGDHHMTAGVHFERTEAYAPVPSWTNIKLQLALTVKHRFGLAYLQAELKTPHDYVVSNRLWWDKVSAWLKGYGFFSNPRTGRDKDLC
jgi:hypothetical protein